MDGWKKLKQNAVPTVFNIPNPPPMLSNKRIKGIGRPKPDSLLASHLNTSEKVYIVLSFFLKCDFYI